MLVRGREGCGSSVEVKLSQCIDRDGENKQAPGTVDNPTAKERSPCQPQGSAGLASERQVCGGGTLLLIFPKWQGDNAPAHVDTVRLGFLLWEDHSSELFGCGTSQFPFMGSEFERDS